MNAPADPNAAAAASAEDGGMSLGELLALSPTADRHARAEHRVAIPNDVTGRIAQWAQYDGGAPETAFVAAWMLLLRRWSGRATAAGLEPGPRTITLRVDLDLPAGPYLRAVDAVRKAAAPSAEADPARTGPKEQV